MNKSKRQVGEFSQFTYEEIIEKCGKNRKLKNTLNKIFDTYDDVVAYQVPWKWDVEEDGEFAYKNEDYLRDTIELGEKDPDNGWEVHQLEPIFSERYEGFNHEFNEINETQCIFVTDEDDHISITIYDKDKMTDGILTFWGITDTLTNEH